MPRLELIENVCHPSGIRLGNSNSTQIWARKLANGDVAVGLYNRGAAVSGGAAADITVFFGMPGINLVGAVNVFDIWEKKALGKFSSKFTASAVPFHSTSFLRLSLA
jgi:alpha-galactosidase